MFWIRSGLHSISISDWLTAGPALAGEPVGNLEDARKAMLEALGDAAARRASLQLRIRTAADARALWELRQEVMNAVSHMYGESEGRRRLALVTPKFEGLLAVASAPRRGRAAPAVAAR
jgi:hypothetical protein